jgi:hypothetical protein
LPERFETAQELWIGKSERWLWKMMGNTLDRNKIKQTVKVTAASGHLIRLSLLVCR